MADPALFSGTFAFQKNTSLGGVGTSDGTILLGGGEMADYPFEVVQFSSRNRGRTDSGAPWVYTHFEGKHRWSLQFRGVTRFTTETMASFFNSTATFRFNSNYDVPVWSKWFDVVSVTEEWRPYESYIELWNFDAVIEEV